MKEGKTRYAVLGLLCEGPMSGYAIKKLVDARFHLFWSESYGQLYPVLKDLLREGLVEAVPTDAAADVDERDARASGARVGAARRGGPERSAYAVTPAGREALRAWLARPAERESMRMEILLKAYFAGLGDRASLAPQLRAFEERYAAELALLERFRAELEGAPDPDGRHGDAIAAIDFGRTVCEAYVAWSRTARARAEGR